MRFSRIKYMTRLTARLSRAIFNGCDIIELLDIITPLYPIAETVKLYVELTINSDSHSIKSNRHETTIKFSKG